MPTRILGVKTEKVRVGLRTMAVRVTEVREGSPAAKAGIEKGDVILDADGTPASDATQLEAAVQKSGTVLTLKVLDPRTRREVPVQVHFDAAAAVNQGSNPPAREYTAARSRHRIDSPPVQSASSPRQERPICCRSSRLCRSCQAARRKKRESSPETPLWA